MPRYEELMKRLKGIVTGEDNVIQPGDEAKFNPAEPRNFLVEKLGLPESLKVSEADRKNYFKNFAEMAGTGTAGTVGKVIPSKRFGDIMQLGLKGEEGLGRVIQKGMPEEGFGKVIEAAKEGASVVKPTVKPEPALDMAEGLDAIKSYLRSKGASEEQIAAAIKKKYGF